MIDSKTKLHAIFGQPVTHSLSPLIFNKTFEKLGVNRAYVGFDVPPKHLKPAVEAARALGFEGFNVTMPHKTTITRLLENLDRSARETGAVNTVARTSRGLTGYNTDGEGALRAIRASGFDPKRKRVLVLGAGGAARALVHRISREAGEVLVLSRTSSRAKEAASRAEGKAKVSYDKLDPDILEESVSKTDLLINATPLQTPALLDELGLSPTILKDKLSVFDLAYDEPPLPLPATVSRISPLEMLVQQAALSYEIWFDRPAPLDIMRSTLSHDSTEGWK